MANRRAKEGVANLAGKLLPFETEVETVFRSPFNSADQAWSKILAETIWQYEIGVCCPKPST